MEPSGSAMPPPSPPPGAYLKTGLPGPTSFDAERKRKVSYRGRPRWCWQAVVGGAVIPAVCIPVWILVWVDAIKLYQDLIVHFSVLLTLLVLPPASVLLGIVAAFRIRRSDGVLKGKVLAVLAIGWLGFMWLLAMMDEVMQ